MVRLLSKFHWQLKFCLVLVCLTNCLMGTGKLNLKIILNFHTQHSCWCEQPFILIYVISGSDLQFHFLKLALKKECQNPCCYLTQSHNGMPNCRLFFCLQVTCNVMFEPKNYNSTVYYSLCSVFYSLKIMEGIF